MYLHLHSNSTIEVWLNVNFRLNHNLDPPYQGFGKLIKIPSDLIIGSQVPW